MASLNSRRLDGVMVGWWDGGTALEFLMGVIFMREASERKRGSE